MDEPIRILLVDMFAIVRQGEANFLHEAADLLVVGEYAYSEDVLACCNALRVDVVLFNPEQIEDCGVSFVRLLGSCCTNVRAIALGEWLLLERVQALLQAGVVGYLLKNTTAQEMIQAVRAVHQGQGALAPEVAHVLLHPSPQEATLERLTAREREVLNYLVQGLHNDEIAERMVVTISTVKAHLHHLFQKLRVVNRTQAVALALHYQQRVELCE